MELSLAPMELKCLHQMWTHGYVYQWTLTTPWDVSTNQRSASDDLNTRSLFGVTLSGGFTTETLHLARMELNYLF